MLQLILLSFLIGLHNIHALTPLQAASLPPSKILGTYSFEEAVKKKATDDATKEFYKKNGYRPVWILNGSLTSCGKKALDLLEHSHEEGLDLHDYIDASHAIRRLIASSQPSIEDHEKAELLLTQRTLEYIQEIKAGQVTPRLVDRRLSFNPPNVDEVEILLDATQNPQEGCKTLENLPPKHVQYIKLKAELARLHVLKNSIKELPKVTTKEKLKIGMTHPEVITLRRLLILLGDLSPKYIDDQHNPLFDQPLEDAVIMFQGRHYLKADGVIGNSTREILNKPLETLIRKIKINMERWRWMPENMGRRYVLVNVGGYYAYAVEDNIIVKSIPAIVGRVSRQTPIFFAKVDKVVINPSWGVPYSIFVQDKLPLIQRKGADYLVKNGFTVFGPGGEKVSPYSVDWGHEGYSYHITQSPGAKNALGRIKFSFKNIDTPTIRMHGTPSMNLFNNPSRAESSGCIRLKTPEELALWILKDRGGWSLEKIKALIDKGSTVSYDLINDEEVPVYATYITVWIDDHGKAYYSDDPYKMDERLITILHA